MVYLELYWSSTHPDSTLKKIGECVSKSTLRRLFLVVNIPLPVTEERAKEWLQCVEVGGKHTARTVSGVKHSRQQQQQLTRQEDRKDYLILISSSSEF